MPQFNIIAPDGRVVTVEGETAPTETDAAEIFSGLPKIETKPYEKVQMRGTPLGDPQAEAEYSRHPEIVDPLTANRLIQSGTGALADITTEGGAATGGQLLGARMGAPGLIVGGAVGGAAGNYAAQKRRVLAGEQEKVQPGQILASMFLGGIPGAPLSSAGAKAFLREGGKQAAGGLFAKNLQTLVDEGRIATPTEAVLSTALPAAGGVLAQKIQGANPEIQAAAASAAESGALRRATFEEGKKAGLVVPPSTVNPSFATKRLESVAGKAAMGQAASVENQKTVNQLAKKALGLPEGEDISMASLRDLRKKSAAPYEEIEALATNAKGEADALKAEKFTASEPHELAIQMADPETQKKLQPLLTQAAGDVNLLKDARFDANKFRKHYAASADPESLEKARAAAELAEKLEDRIEKAAETIGAGQEFIKRLRDARTLIAKSYDVEHALNLATGDVSAPILARALDKGRPLTGELETIAKFAEAFPSVMREGAKIPTPGVSKVEAGMIPILAAAGMGTTQSPYGLLAGALPLTSGAVRSGLLSRPGQTLLANIPDPVVKAAPDALSTATREVAQAAGQEIPTLTSEEARKAAPGKFRGTNGKTYEKKANGEIILTK